MNYWMRGVEGLKELLFVGIMQCCEEFVSGESMITCFLAQLWGESIAIGS